MNISDHNGFQYQALSRPIVAQTVTHDNRKTLMTVIPKQNSEQSKINYTHNTITDHWKMIRIRRTPDCFPTSKVMGEESVWK